MQLTWFLALLLTTFAHASCPTKHLVVQPPWLSLASFEASKILLLLGYSVDYEPIKYRYHFYDSQAFHLERIVRLRNHQTPADAESLLRLFSTRIVKHLALTEICSDEKQIKLYEVWMLPAATLVGDLESVQRVAIDLRACFIGYLHPSAHLQRHQQQQQKQKQRQSASQVKIGRVKSGEYEITHTTKEIIQYMWSESDVQRALPILAQLQLACANLSNYPPVMSYDEVVQQLRVQKAFKPHRQGRINQAPSQLKMPKVKSKFFNQAQQSTKPPCQQAQFQPQQNTSTPTKRRSGGILEIGWLQDRALNQKQGFIPSVSSIPSSSNGPTPHAPFMQGSSHGSSSEDFMLDDYELRSSETTPKNPSILTLELMQDSQCSRTAKSIWLNGDESPHSMKVAEMPLNK